MLTVTPARRRLVVATFLVCASTLARASSPKFFQAATQADFLKGEVENLSIDGRGQLVLGPATELVYETPAPFLWTVTPGAGRIDLHRHGQRRSRVPRRCPGQRRAVLRCGGTRSPRDGPGARMAGSYVATSPDGKIYKVDRNGASTTFFDPRGEIHLGARRRRQGQRLRRHRRKRRRLQDHARRQGRAVLSDKGDACDRAGARQVGQPARRHRVTRAGSSRRRRRQGLSSSSTRRFRKFARCGSTTKAHCTSPPSTAGSTSGAAPSISTDTGSSGAADIVTHAGGVGVGVDRNHRGRRCRNPGAERFERVTRRQSADQRGDLSHRARRPVGSAVGIEGGLSRTTWHSTPTDV